MCIYIYIYRYVYMYMYIYIYICIEREREREREMASWAPRSTSSPGGELRCLRCPACPALCFREVNKQQTVINHEQTTSCKT